tara:strand:- start:11 stop:208 length:198 start_codon:yes stop_codon:yes gene_type:complete
MQTERLILQLSPELKAWIEENSTPHTRSNFVVQCLTAFRKGQSERGILERIAYAMENRYPEGVEK